MNVRNAKFIFRIQIAEFSFNTCHINFAVYAILSLDIYKKG